MSRDQANPLMAAGIDVQTSAGLLARHDALLERVTVLERALEEIAENTGWDGNWAAEQARRALDDA